MALPIIFSAQDIEMNTVIHRNSHISYFIQLEINTKFEQMRIRHIKGNKNAFQ